jgi:hypothetical protein
VGSPRRWAGFAPANVALLAVGLFAARLLAAHFAGFFGLDEVSLANGVAALLRHSDADFYRYAPQVGYYRLIEALSLFTGGQVAYVPHLMIGVSALAGTVIPCCGWFIFADRLTRVERAVLAGILVCNPILWMSSTYGNSAMASAMFAMVGLTILSNRTSRSTRVVAFVALGLAILIRADAVLLVPVAALLRWQERRSLRHVLRSFAPFIAGLAATYGLLFWLDPRMTGAVASVTSHLTNPRFQTHFWDYLLWSISPIVLLLAAFGLNGLLESRRDLVAAVTVWCLPLFAFYYSATTTPRYFVPTVLPVAICAACGMVALPQLFARRRLVVALLAVAATAHLFVNLGYYTPGSFKQQLREGSIETQIGPLWTGGLLYHSYAAPSLLFRSIRNPGFHRTILVQRSLDSLLADVASGSYRGHTIVAVLGSWNGHLWHYYAELHGARYTARKPGPVFQTETWLDLGGARLMSIGRGTIQFHDLETLPVKAGDLVWLVNPGEGSEAEIRSKVKGLELAPLSDSTPNVRRYAVADGR